MHYPFPIIRTISDVLPHIQDESEFRIFDKGLYKVINYTFNTPETFPDVVDVRTAMLRECRGLIFDKEGKILSRRYHKFFNAGEKQETMAGNIDMNRRHHYLDKADGSMITPLWLETGFRWATKMGVTDVALPVEAFVKKNPYYEKVAYAFHSCNKTPIFEWCSRQQRIVVDYGFEDQLILTAVRHNITGEYMSYEDLLYAGNYFGVPVINRFHLPYLGQDFLHDLAQIKAKDSIEGVVIRFDNGHMVKVKTEWYSLLHKTKAAVEKEHNVLKLIALSKVDDLLPNLIPADQDEVIRYQREVIQNIKLSALMVETIVHKAKQDNLSRKEFALERVPLLSKAYSCILFKVWEGQDAAEAIMELVARCANKAGNIEQIRPLIGNAKYKEMDLNE